MTQMAANGLQICDGRAFYHKCSFGELNFLITTKLSAEHETPPIANVLLAAARISPRSIVVSSLSCRLI